MNTTDELATWISNGDVAIFHGFGLIRGDPKFGQELGYVAALQVKCLRVYALLFFLYMVHRYH